MSDIYKFPVTTICAKCKHFSGGAIWYNQKCTARTLERRQDLVTGEMVHGSENDLGRWVSREDQHPYCRDVNDGHCDLYEEARNG